MLELIWIDLLSSGKNVFLKSNDTKLELFGLISGLSGAKKNKAYEQKNTIATVKHGGGPVLLWSA